ncbi:MAG TPA: HsmA family protein [Anaerolineaceae bacterium]
MTSTLIVAIVCMVLALTLYSVGVWSERFAGKLKINHLTFFWLGWVFDTTGTSLMTVLAGKMEFSFHSVTGALAIALMFGHAIWASLVLIKKEQSVLAGFHKFSTAVWAIWLVPFISGLTVAMLA